jgi:hypothetical protein
VFAAPFAVLFAFAVFVYGTRCGASPLSRKGRYKEDFECLECCLNLHPLEGERSIYIWVVRCQPN